MDLEEAKLKFLNKTCNIKWNNPTDRAGAAVPKKTERVLIMNIYKTFDNLIYFRCDSKIYTPFSVDRLELSE